MKICIYGSANEDIDIAYRNAGEQLGEAMAKAGHTLIFGGGANGMMGAVARGMRRFGGKIIGISPEFFNVDGVLFESCSEMIYTADMRSRKEKLEDMADAFIVTPGGIGTMDEFFETLSLKQLGIIKKPLVLFNVNGFYDNLITLLKTSADRSFIGKEDILLFSAASGIDELMENFK